MNASDSLREPPLDPRALSRASVDGPVRRRLLSLFADVVADIHAGARRGEGGIAQALRAARELSSADRRLVSDAMHDLVRLYRRLAHLAGSDDPALLVDEWVASRRAPALAEEKLARIADPMERFAVSASLPDWLAQRLVAAYALDGATALGEAMNRRAPLTVRVNRHKGTREQLAEALSALGIASSPTALSPDGLTLHTRQNVYALAPFRDGWMELQDEGSQLIAELVAPPPRGVVIDACAGAGGKTLALAAALENKGRVIAYDVGEDKLEELRKRARRAGLTNVQAIASQGGGPPDGARPAERVLLDVPCSGTGAMRRNPESRWRLGERDLVELREKQRAILEAYAPLVAPGGRLVYATCSVLPEENEAQVEAFLAAHPAFEPVPAKEILGRPRALAIGDGDALRLLPHVHGTDGFYARVLRRSK